MTASCALWGRSRLRAHTDLPFRRSAARQTRHRRRVQSAPGSQLADLGGSSEASAGVERNSAEELHTAEVTGPSPVRSMEHRRRCWKKPAARQVACFVASPDADEAC